MTYSAPARQRKPTLWDAKVAVCHRLGLLSCAERVDRLPADAGVVSWVAPIGNILNPVAGVTAMTVDVARSRGSARAAYTQRMISLRCLPVSTSESHPTRVVRNARTESLLPPLDRNDPQSEF